MKKIINSILIIFLLTISLPVLAQTQEGTKKDLQDQTNTFGGAAGLNIDINDSNVGSIASTVISILLGVLGLLFVVLLIYSGFMWMTAQGNEDQAKKALDTIKMAIIGLIIIVAAYSITVFVFNSLSSATTGGTIVPTN